MVFNDLQLLELKGVRDMHLDTIKKFLENIEVKDLKEGEEKIIAFHRIDIEDIYDHSDLVLKKGIHGHITFVVREYYEGVEPIEEEVQYFRQFYNTINRYSMRG